MNFEALQTLLLRRRGAVLAALVIILGATAALLAVQVIGQARDLAAGSPLDASSSSPVAALSHHDHQPEPSDHAEPTAAPTTAATPVPTPVPTPPAPPDPDAPWTLAASFGDGQWGMGVADIEVWRDGFVAVGTDWEASNPRPVIWRSSDGRTWSSTALELGVAVALEVVAPLPDGRLVILGTVGGSVEYWSDPERAAAWVTVDGAAWTSVPLPFGEGVSAGPVDFTAGAEGLLATTGDDIWHSPDGTTWQQVYDAPRGSMVYGPVAGNDGWIVKQGNPSRSTTTLLVSGDASTWHEIDLGHVATVANVEGDWLVSRATDDWQGTEILRSANGLQWTRILDLDELAPSADVTAEWSAGVGGGAMLAGTSEVVVLSPWQAGHCGAMPSGGWGAWWSSDATGWQPTGLGGDAVVTHAVSIGSVTVLAGYTAFTGDVAFWVSAR